jgi:hypothetical protein
MEATSSRNILRKLNHTLKLDQLSQPARRIIIGAVGGTIVLIGVALVFLPGPAFVVIPLGLAVLASEFAWARRLIDKGRHFVKKAKKESTR